MALTDGLVAYYTLGGDAIDSTGNNHGTISGATETTNAILGNSMSFDGIDDYIDTGYDLDEDSDYSLSAWIKWVQNTNYNHIISTYNGTGTNGIHLAIGSSSSSTIPNHIYFSINNGSFQTLDSGVQANDGNWHFVVVTKSGTTYKIYVDGVLKNSGTYTVTSNSASVHIGASAQVGNYYKGIIDEVGIWNRALTDSEVTTMYNSGAGARPSILKLGNRAYYSFDADNGNDDSGNGNNGTFNGTPLFDTGILGDAVKSEQSVANHIKTPNTDDLEPLLGDMSYSIWVKSADGSSTGSSIAENLFCIRNNGGSSPTYIGVNAEWLKSDQKIRFIWDDGQYGFIKTNNAVLQDTNWHHLVFTLDRDNESNINIWIDGIKQAVSFVYETNFADTQQSIDSNVEGLIGSEWYDYPNNSFGGLLDEFGIYSRVLAKDEILALNNSGLGYNPYSEGTTGWSELINGTTANKIDTVDVTNISKVNGVA